MEMQLDVRCSNCGEPIAEYEHTQAVGRLVHCGNCGSFNSVDEPLQTS